LPTLVVNLAAGQQLGPPAMAGPRKGLREGKAADEKPANPWTYRPEAAQGPADAVREHHRLMPVRAAEACRAWAARARPSKPLRFPATEGDLEH
jgi:hypothetical protein